MLSKILSKEDCAKCKFCCSFRRQSLWETPIFDKRTKEMAEKLVEGAKFKTLENGFYTIDLDNEYKTDDSEEEAKCPFLIDGKGCVLPFEIKPFDCSIWPFRVIKNHENKNEVVLTPTCPAVNKIPMESIKKFAKEEISEEILKYAENHPEIIKNEIEKDGKDFFIRLSV